MPRRCRFLIGSRQEEIRQGRDRIHPEQEEDAEENCFLNFTTKKSKKKEKVRWQLFKAERTEITTNKPLFS